HDISAVEGNYRWIFPRLNQRQEMHSDVAKVDVQKMRARFTQNAEQLAQFCVGDLPRLIAQLSKPKPPEDMRSRLGNEPKRLKGIARGVFAFLRNHHRGASFQTDDLPVDMQHLRFEKRRAITRDNRG